MTKNSDHKQMVHHDKINYVGAFSFLRTEGCIPRDVSPIDYITEQEKHGLKQIMLPERTADHQDLDYEREFGISPLHDYPYGVDIPVLQLALIDLANTIARLTGSYPDHETLKMHVARIFHCAICDAEIFIDEHPELNAYESSDED